MNIRQIQEARELYGIEGWGNGYFGINDQGHVVANPTGEERLGSYCGFKIANGRLRGPRH